MNENTIRAVGGEDYRPTARRKAKKVNSLSFGIIGGKEVMPVGVWWGPYTNGNKSFPDYNTEEYYGYMKDLGVNFTSAVPNTVQSWKEVVMKSLKLSEKFGFGYFVNDAYFRGENITAEAMKKQVSEYIESPACFGVHVLDEPYPNEVPKLKNAFDTFGKLGFDDKYLYVNLLPMYGRFGDDDTRLKNYENYVEEYCTLLKPKFLSYDFYAFKRAEYEWGRLKMFFDNLSIIRRIAKNHGIPFWAFVQTGGQFQCERKAAEEEPEYPTEEGFLWNVNACLLYGAKCIQYFTFIQPDSFIHTAKGVIYDNIGIIGADGHKTKWYEPVKRANSIIRSYQKYLMNAENLGVIAVGKANELVFGDEKIKSGTFRELKKIKSENAILGCFDYEGRTTLFVMNGDYEKETEIELSFDMSRGFDIISDGATSFLAGDKITSKLKKGASFIAILR